VPDATVPETFHLTLEFPYQRTTGPVIGPFLTALRDGRILADRVGGRVVCPPLEYDPATGATVDPDFVDVGPGGVVESWTWVSEPTRRHPFDHPFAFGLIRLDGADTPLAHAIDAGSIERMSTGMRVRAQFRDERRGAITDVYFVPEADARDQSIEPGDDPVAVTESFISLEISESLSPHRVRFVQGLLGGKIIGQRSPVSGKVYVPGRGYDNMERVPMGEADEVELEAVGSVSAFTVITPVDYYGQKETEPYIRASILLDGADQALIGIDIRDIPEDEFRVGMRMRAVWKPPEERRAGADNRGVDWEQVIERWEPTGEPDADARRLEDYAF
jgi:uncharacterized protein